MPETNCNSQLARRYPPEKPPTCKWDAGYSCHRLVGHYCGVKLKLAESDPSCDHLRVEQFDIVSQPYFTYSAPPPTSLTTMATLDTTWNAKQWDIAHSSFRELILFGKIPGLEVVPDSVKLEGILKTLSEAHVEDWNCLPHHGFSAQTDGYLGDIIERIRRFWGELIGLILQTYSAEGALAADNTDMKEQVQSLVWDRSRWKQPERFPILEEIKANRDPWLQPDSFWDDWRKRKLGVEGSKKDKDGLDRLKHLLLLRLSRDNNPEATRITTLKATLSALAEFHTEEVKAARAWQADTIAAERLPRSDSNSAIPEDIFIATNRALFWEELIEGISLILRKAKLVGYSTLEEIFTKLECTQETGKGCYDATLDSEHQYSDTYWKIVRLLPFRDWGTAPDNHGTHSYQAEPGSFIHYPSTWPLHAAFDPHPGYQYYTYDNPYYNPYYNPSYYPERTAPDAQHQRTQPEDQRTSRRWDDYR